MSVFDVLELICGLALFLYGMNLMGDALKRSAGNKLKITLGKLTSTPLLGALLGLGVTAIIQSSAATTVMVMGFVNAGTMTLTQSVGVIIGANVGTAVTAWLTGLSGLNESGAAIADALKWLTPNAWMPVLAFVGILLWMFAKRDRKRDIGAIMLGFSILMVGMSTMSGAVGALKTSPDFQSLLVVFNNPLFGVLAGTVLAAIIQSSSAGIGILQSMTVTGALSFTTSLPLIIGINIGSSAPPLISSIGANRNAKRAAFVYLVFNVLGGAIFLGGYYALDALLDFSFADETVNMFGVALLHTIFKAVSAIIMLPFSKLLEKLSGLCVPDKKDDSPVSQLDDRLLNTPSVAVEQASYVTRQMAKLSAEAMQNAIGLLGHYDAKVADEIRRAEAEIDKMEDSLGTYLVKLSNYTMIDKDNREITKMLHLIGDFERISDHAVNVLESAEEARDKGIVFSDEATHEMAVLRDAVSEIISLAERCYAENDLLLAAEVEPLEQVVDDLKDQIKLNHVLRLQKNECSIEPGFILSDLLTNFERVSDHCSNIAGCVIELGRYDELNMHQYLGEVKKGGDEFDRKFLKYQSKYAL